MSSINKKIAAFAASMVLAATSGAGVISSINTSAAGNGQAVTNVSKKFDLGANATGGFTTVKAADKYSANKGYGFSGNNVKDVAASGRNELSDAVQFTGNTTFNADVPNGLYKVKVTLGNTSRTSVYMENMLQIVNMTGNNAVDEIILPVTDGQLNIRAAAGKDGTPYSISAIEINRISDKAVMPKTVWLCGDSTVCNYYPLTSSNQAGWGQMLGKYLGNDVYIRNMAASGEYAKGFVDHGNFNCIEKYGKSGDTFIISIGINDGKYYKGAEYKKVVTDMVKRAKAKGMDVILVKQQGRKGDYTLKPLLKSRYFAAELDQIASEQGCKIIDLFTLWQNYCVSVGASKADSMYIDNVHPNRTGADKLAELVASKMDKTNSSPSNPSTPSDPPTYTTDIIDGQVYTFKNVNSGLYLSVEGAAAANGANVEQGNANGKQVQFKAVSAGDGYFYLVSQLGDGKTYALDVNGRHTEDETNIEIYEFNKGENQKFRIDKNSDGTYSILTKITDGNSALDVNGKSTNAGANVQQYTYKGSTNQKWYAEAVKQNNNDNPQNPQNPPVVQTSDITDGQIYTIKNLNSGLYLSVKGSNAGNGVNVEQAAANGAQNKFKAVSAGDGYFYLVSQLGDGNSYALDVNGKKTEDGTNIELYTFNKGENQKFKFVKNSDGTYSILTKITDGKSALDVNGQSRDAGANIQQYTYNGGNNQKWYVETSSTSGNITTGSYPVVTSIEYNAIYHQFKMNWTSVKNAEKYGIAVYLAGKWRVQTYTNDTTFTSPKLKAGDRYRVLVAARVGGQWDLSDLKERSVIISIK